MQVVVYCDESRHSPDHRFMAIGSLWLPRDEKEQIAAALKKVCADARLNAEIKWKKVGGPTLAGYEQLVRFFAEDARLRFRVIVVDQSKLKDEYHGSDRELGFFKFYYELLEKWMERGNEYLFLLDFKKNKGADRFTTLRRVLENKTKGTAWISDLTVINSEESRLAQLCDLLTGAVAAEWNGIAKGSAKETLAHVLAKSVNLPHLRAAAASPAPSKFNVFNISLQ